MCALDQDSVDGVWTGPSFRRPQHDCRPRTRPLLSAACGTLHLADLLVRLRDRLIQLRKHRVGVVTGDDDRRPPLSTKIGLDVFVAAASVDRRPGDLGTVHVQDRQHRAVASWIQERRELPRAGQRPGLRFAVADHTGHHEVRMIEGSAGRMGKGVAELAAFVDASGCLHTHMAGHSAGERRIADTSGGCPRRRPRLPDRSPSTFPRDTSTRPAPDRRARDRSRKASLRRWRRCAD